eukprot:scaffold43567_cov59-Attheya_sp.AAC.2
MSARPDDHITRYGHHQQTPPWCDEKLFFSPVLLLYLFSDNVTGLERHPKNGILPFQQKQHFTGTRVQFVPPARGVWAL